MSIEGTVSILVRFLHHDKPVYHANYGVRDVETKLLVTEETIFPGCSLTKVFTAATLSLLVEEKKVTWATFGKDVLPGFDIKMTSLATTLP